MLLSLDHHAYVIAGPKDAILEFLLKTLDSSFSISVRNNPDVRTMHFESLGIEESRLLKEMQAARPVAGERKILIVSTNAITVQAQNAMLKMLEEPLGGTLFFIIVPTTSFFIDTLLSRVVRIEHGNVASADSGLDAKKFIKMTYSERLKVVEKFLKANRDSKESKTKVQDFFGSLENELHEHVSKNKDVLENLLEVKQYIFDTSSSLKILLETISLILP